MKARKIMAVLPDATIGALGIAGAGLISFGAWQIYRPAGFIVAGLLLLVGSLRLAR